MNVSQILAKWYDKNKRPLPWRRTCDPYKIWLSEVILQQTRVNQGFDYYLRFIEKYPSIVDLANAPVDEVLRLWQGLGYYTRARNMHKTAEIIRDLFKGNFPSEYDEIKKLKGIGDYTAAAIASIAFGLAYPVVDGNVFRFLSRFYGIHIPVDSTQGKKVFYKLANEMMDTAAPGKHNQAVMEFGALVCLPKNPLCKECPINESCWALANNAIKELPVKTKKHAVIQRYFNYLVIRTGEKIHIRKRAKGDIWALLYEFPCIESSALLTPEKLLTHPDLKTIFNGSAFTLRSVSEEYRHQLSHQLIYARFFELESSRGVEDNEILLIDTADLDHYALPRLIEKYLQQ